jgi:hypothetical protein
MKPLTEFFCDYLFATKSEFHKVYVAPRADVLKPDGSQVLERFVNSRLDINRLKAATEFINECIFRVNVWPELGVLREAVAEREVRRDMRYEMYRDHTCHTLWGFLLGCLLFEHSSKLRKLVTGLTDASDDQLTATNLKDFGGMWLLGFLCHDIGYLFESDIPAGMTPDPLLDLQAACALLNDYFHGYYISTYVGESSTENFIELQKLDYPNYPNNSLSIVAQSLRRLPFANDVVIDATAKSFKVPADAFELFRVSGCADVESIEKAYRFLYETGRWGQKFLDHGVVSGLLMAQILVLGYCLHMIVRYPVGNPGNGRYTAPFVDSVRAKTEYGEDLTIEMLKRRVRWVFAAARHNIDPEWWTKKPVIAGQPPAKLKPEADPASFLVILVDMLQDWDRPRMNANIRPDDLLMDSADIELDINAEKLRIRARSGLPKKRIEKLRQDLDARLEQWTDFVELV